MSTLSEVQIRGALDSALRTWHKDTTWRVSTEWTRSDGIQDYRVTVTNTNDVWIEVHRGFRRTFVATMSSPSLHDVMTVLRRINAPEVTA